MSVFTKIAGAYFSLYSANLGPLPFQGLADSFHLYGFDEASSLRNRLVKPDDDDSAIIGAPTFDEDEGFANFSCGTNGITSGLSGHTPFTTILVATEPSGSGTRGLAGNCDGSTFRNLLYTSGATKTITIDGSGKAPLTFTPGAAFALMAATHDGVNAKTYAHNGTDLLSATQAATGGAGSTIPFRVGGTGTGTGNFKAAAAVRYPFAMSAAQILLVRAYLKPLLLTRAVTML